MVRLGKQSKAPWRPLAIEKLRDTIRHLLCERFYFVVRGSLLLGFSLYISPNLSPSVFCKTIVEHQSVHFAVPTEFFFS